MAARGAEAATAYGLALKACDQLLREARAGEIPEDEWTVEELEELRATLAARVASQRNGFVDRA
jgi:hypothetical protein